MGAGGGTGEPTKCADGYEEELPATLPTFSSDVRLVDAPIFFLAYLLKAVSAELVRLRRLIIKASERGSRSPDLILDLRGRFEFLSLVCKYHCAVEDEVVFVELDACIKNVVCAYSLEHKSINDLFCSIFNSLDLLLMENGDVSSLQELVLRIGTILATICQHIHKEEKQILPLLIQHLPSKQQNTLVWQFICSVPLMLLEDLFPWIFSFLTPHEQMEVRHCILEVVPKDKLLQELVIFWMSGKENLSFQGYYNYGKGEHLSNRLANFRDMLKLDTSKRHNEEERKLKKVGSLHCFDKQNPIDGMNLLHGTIRRDLKEILTELYQLKGSHCITTIASVTVHLKFFTNILIFYGHALDKVFYPLLDGLAKNYSFLSPGKCLDESHIEVLQRLLYSKIQNAASVDNFVEKLYIQLELFAKEIDKHIEFLETEVFSFIRTKCSFEMQQWLLYTSLHVMPLGLLKCMVIWFSAHFSENESKKILGSLKQGEAIVNGSFTSLLHEWIRIGYSGKTSLEKFRKDLQTMFDCKGSLLSEKNSVDTKYPCLQSDNQICSKSKLLQLESKLTTKDDNCVTGSAPSSSNLDGKPETFYYSGVNLSIFFPQKLKMLSHCPTSSGCNAVTVLSDIESKPMDHIFFFHKALTKDLENLVSMSTKLEENNGFLVDFQKGFHLLRSLYQIHSDSEDEFAFPALEAKDKLQNVSHSYSIDHRLETDLFNKISLILTEISRLHVSVFSEQGESQDQTKKKYHQLCLELHDMCISVHKILSDHVHREEVELWPLFRECIPVKEQEKIIGHMLGRIRAEILQEMIPWLMSYLNLHEQHAIMSLWLNVTKNTMFKEWLGEWWEGMKMYNMDKAEDEDTTAWAVDPLEVVSMYLQKECFDKQQNVCGQGTEMSRKDFDEKTLAVNIDQNSHKYSVSAGIPSELNTDCAETADFIHLADNGRESTNLSLQFGNQEHCLSQGELEATIRRISRDSNLDPQKKSCIIQNLLMSRWVASQKKSHLEISKSINNEEEFPGQFPSYRDHLKSTLGCKHYKRNCKLLASCCNKLYACVRCHDEMADHQIDRKAITKMMCMKCLIIQPIGPTCSTVSCSNLSMARYYCRICKLFDDERVIYHCPFCNLCRVGRGLGIDYFHCMNCNACMSRSLSVHICREKCFEDNCPICHEYIFTSSSPVKALPCGHLMHSACFQDYTCVHYTCPICSKSLGDMQVYFEMLDTLLAEEKIPDEYSGETQVILCNDCERKGTAAYHWLYHKCSYCGSYNTRLV